MRHLITLAAVAALAGCSVDVEGAACRVPGTADDCPAGQACGAGKTCSVAAAACDVCIAGERACKGGKVTECTAADPVCGSWAVIIDDCAADLLACADGAAPACVCPAHLESPVVLHADPNAATRQGLIRNGAAVSACRYLSLNDALNAATDGNRVKAVGFSGVPVVFTEPPLTIPAGVSVITDDVTPTPANYVIEPSVAVGATASVTLRPGASLVGVTIRNTGATGVGVDVDCPGPGDTATITVDSVHVAGEGTGTPAPRFSNGLRHGGNCSLILTNSIVEGANDTGVLVTGAAAATSLTMTGNLIHRNLASLTPYTIGASDRFGGGLVIFGTTHPDTVTFKGNRLHSNAGDQILVFSPGTLDLSTPACGVDSNTIACYTAPGVGVSSRFGTVNVAHSNWQNDLPASGIDFLAAAGATIAGATTLACGAASITCP